MGTKAFKYDAVTIFELAPGPIKRLTNLIHAVKELEQDPVPPPVEEKKTPEEIFRKVLIATIVRWAEESQIEMAKLVREMFR